jgi:hypothetical protein
MRAIALVAIVGLSLGAAPSQGRAGTTPPRPLSAQWELAARIYYPDGRTAAAFDGPAASNPLAPVTRDFMTSQNLCIFNTPSSRHPTEYGWHVVVSPLRETATELVVRVDWRRTYDRGKPVTSPTDSVEITLRPREGRIPLDYILPDRAAAGDCKAIGMMLEIRIGN